MYAGCTHQLPCPCKQSRWYVVLHHVAYVKTASLPREEPFPGMYTCCFLRCSQCLHNSECWPLGPNTCRPCMLHQVCHYPTTPGSGQQALDSCLICLTECQHRQQKNYDARAAPPPSFHGTLKDDGQPAHLWVFSLKFVSYLQACNQTMEAEQLLQ